MIVAVAVVVVAWEVVAWEVVPDLGLLADLTFFWMDE
jgi:hypothetical protein